MAERTNTAPAKGTPTPKKSKSWKITPENIRAAADVVNVGLMALEQNKKTRPYAQALRAITTAGAVVTDAQASPLIQKIVAARLAIKELEQAEGAMSEERMQKIGTLRTQLDTYLDLWIEAL